MLIPAFSDLHIHAPQYTERGRGMDCLLFDWLSKYTFPEESKFSDISYARVIYAQMLRDLLRHGTLHASFFTTLHYEATGLLFRMLEESGMQAFCGITNMDRNTTDEYVDTTEVSLQKTERFIREFGQLSGGTVSTSAKVKPILTPRFAPTCSGELLEGLGKLGEKYGIGMQTHLVESKEEATWSKELFPDCGSDGEIYEKYHLLENGPTIFAHVIFPTDVEKRILRERKAVSVHCPDATTSVTAGIMPFKEMKKEGFRLSLGSDIGAGHLPAVYRQAGRAVQLSKMKEFYEGTDCRITFAEAFAAATMGGAEVFSKTGRLEAGYRFDALVIGGLEDEGSSLTPEERVERFCYLGDDRNIRHRFLDGKHIDPDEVYQRLLENSRQAEGMPK